MPTHPRGDGWNAFWAEENTYLDSDEFKNYAAMIEIIVLISDVPVGTRQIHDILGEHIRREWTLDALGSLKSVEIIHGLIDRWKPICGAKPTHRRRWNGAGMSWLFGRNRDSAEFADTGANI